MFKLYLKTIAIVGLFALFPGCSQQSINKNETDLEKNWGRSYESAKYNQFLNPDTSNLNPAEGLDGQAANNNVENYRDSFDAKKSKETVNILKLQ